MQSGTSSSCRPGGQVVLAGLALRVISLDRTPKRLEWFRTINGVLPASLLHAVDGTAVDRADLERRGIIEHSIPFTDGAIGCMLSHLMLWELAENTNQTIVVFEDDALIHSRFTAHAETMLAGLPRDWHICLFGYNFDAYLLFDMLPGVSPCLAAFDQEAVRRSLSTFRMAEINPVPYRLIRAFGTISYAISPAGAKVMRKLCLPIPNRPVAFHDRTLANNGIDITMNGVYQQVNAFVSFPPLVVTANEHGISTVQT